MTTNSGRSLSGVAVVTIVLLCARALAEEPRDVLLVTSVLDFSVEGLKERVSQDDRLAFRIVLPTKGLVRGQVLTQLRATSTGNPVVFQETWLYDDATVGHKHLVYVDPRQLPGPGTYELSIEIGGVRAGDDGRPATFEHVKRFPVTVEAATAEHVAVKGETRLEGQVHFAYASFLVAADDTEIVRTIAARFLGQSRTALLIVEGHTDTAGGAAYNLDLSAKRAHEVKKALTKAGVPANRIRTYGYGYERLVARGDDDAAAARNRRVEFVIVGGQ